MSIQKSLANTDNPTLSKIIESGDANNWHYAKVCVALGYGRRTPLLRKIIEEYGKSWAQLALRQRRKNISLQRIIDAAHKSNWRYVDCCTELGYGSHTGALSRLIAKYGTTWNELAKSEGALTARETCNLIGPQTETELAKYAKKFNWNQSLVARHFGLKSEKTGFSKRLKKWGYTDWIEFCIRHGRERPRLSVALIIETARNHSWDLREIGTVLHYKGHGGILAFLIREGVDSWAAFKIEHAPNEFHDRPLLTMKILIEAAEKHHWDAENMAMELGYKNTNPFRKWVGRRGYKNLTDFKDAYYSDTLKGARTAKKPNHPIARIASENGWHIDLTAWELELDRNGLMFELKKQGFETWGQFYNKYRG